MTSYLRPSWTETLITQALLWSRRATCPRLHAGIVIANDDHQVVASGYNGSLKGMPHCNVVGCLMVDGHCLRTLHAEENAVSFSARTGRSLIDCTAYITARPCQKCTKLLIQSGIKAIYFWKRYNTDQISDQVEEMLHHANVPIYGPLLDEPEYNLGKLFTVSGIHVSP